MRLSKISALGLSAALLLSGLASCKKKEKPSEPPPPVDVTAYTIEKSTIPAVFDYVGFAESSHPVEIRARVEGYLDKIAYQEGQLVKAGDLLFQLDPKPFQAKVEQAKGEVLRQEAILENAKLTVNRLQPLYEKKASSKKDLDNAIANQLSAEASLQSAKAQLIESELNLGYTTIQSPIDGYASKSRFREGALITPGSEGLLTTVSVLDPIWVYFTIADSDIIRSRQQIADKSLTLPQENMIAVSDNNEYVVEAIMSNDSKFPYPGKIDYSSPTYDQNTGTLSIRAVFQNPTADLRPGQFVKVRVYGASRPNVLLVPQRALLQKKNGMYVYLIMDDNKVVAQDVTTGEWYGNYQIVTNGLKVGDKIVVDGINKIQNNSKIKIIGTWKEDEQQIQKEEESRIDKSQP